MIKKLLIFIILLFGSIGISHSQSVMPYSFLGKKAEVNGIYKKHIYYYWSFEETGNVTRVDSARGRTLTPFNTVPDTVAKVGKGVATNNNTTSHLLSPDSVYTQPDSITFISVWYKSYSAATQLVFTNGMGYSCSFTNPLSVCLFPGVYRSCDSTNANIQSAFTYRRFEWQHVAMLLMPGKDSGYVWVNDTLRGSFSLPSMKKIGKFYVGASGNVSFMFPLFGVIDELFCIILPNDSQIVPRKSFVDFLWNSGSGRNYWDVRKYLSP